MKYEEILKAIQGKTIIDVNTAIGSTTITRNPNELWRVRGFMGTLYYTTEELAYELANEWEEEVLFIL